MSSIVTFNIQYDPAVIYEGDIDLNDTLAITALTDNCNIYLKRNNTPSTTSFSDRPINILYSLDEGETWTELKLASQDSSYTVNLGTLNSGKSIYIRGNNFGRSTLYGLNICTDKSASVSGNIMSLFFRKNPRNEFPQYNTYGAFQYIFSGSKITDASQLPLPTTLEDYCYAYMFENCTALTSVPALSATTLEEYCYQGMFKGCSALVNAPELASTSLAEGCYKEMFEGCSSITTAPVLPATTLDNNCYQGMFKGCTSLTTAPELPATRLVNGCYANMFENCTSLNYIHIYSEIQIGSPYTTNWVKNVAPTGTFVGSDNILYTERGDHGIPTGWYYDLAYKYQYFTVEFLDGEDRVKLERNNDNAPNISLYYSLDDGETWSQCNRYSSGTLSTASGTKILLKGNNTTFAKPRYSSGDWYRYDCYNYSFVMDNSRYKVYGNIMSLLNGDDFRTNMEFATGSSCNFAYLFDERAYESRIKLIDASHLVLPATTLTDACYSRMFAGQSSMTSVQGALPATALAKGCYVGMFARCSSITTAPILPATMLTNNCYEDMFSGCTSLTTAPELPATTLADYCYMWMFYGCTSLVKARELPATSLAEGCYQYMFYECTSLVNAPALPATALRNNCYSYMFHGCTSLVNAPALPATTLAGGDTTNAAMGCYSDMFSGCTSLVNAPALPATKLKHQCYYGMFRNCTSLVNAPALPATTLAERCYEEMFENCTSLTTAPALPATTLIDSCYQGMFKGCTSLTTAPDLLAPTMWAQGYYDDMFKGCSSLNYVKCLATHYADDNTVNWLDGVAPSGTFVKRASVDWITGSSGIPSGWNVRVDHEDDYFALEYTGTSTSISIVHDDGAPDISVYYSTNDGDTWTLYNTGDSILLKEYNRVIFKCNATSWANENGANHFSAPNAQWIVAYGNIMSLLNGDNFKTNSNFASGSSYNFAHLFHATEVKADYLLLPATTLTPYCYNHMFYFDARLTTAPVLPATTLAPNCYGYMFGHCISLNYVKCLATDISASACTNGWVDTVSASGTFVKAASMNDWTTGSSGIPSGWTVQNA